jgi:hypothetical protein
MSVAVRLVTDISPAVPLYKRPLLRGVCHVTKHLRIVVSVANNQPNTIA